MNLATVMEQVGTQIATIGGLNVFDFPPDTLSPPTAWVGYPEDYTYDETYGRGWDRINNLPVIVVVGRVSDHSAKDQIGAYANGSGASSIKSVLESGNYTEFDGIRVTGVTFDVLTRGGVDYIAALFTLDITGQGST